MSDKRYLGLTLGVSVALTVLLIVVGAPWWLGLALCAPVFAVGWVVKRQIDNNNRVYESTPVVAHPTPPPPQPVAPAGARFQNLALPSADRDYRFLLHGTVLWRGTASDGAPLSEHLAVNAIRERAARLTRAEPAGEYDLLAPKLAAELSFPVTDSGGLETWATEVAITLPEPDRERLRRLAEVRKDEQVWEHERHHERNKRAYLHDDVFADTGSAVVWWLAQDARDPGKVEEAVELIGALARLTAAANNREVEPVFQKFVDDIVEAAPAGAEWPTPGPDESDVVVGLAGRLMDTILPDASEPERAHMADRLATLLRGLGAADEAAEIRRAFNAPDFAEDEADDSAGTDGTEPEPDGQAPAEPVAVNPNGEAPDPADRTWPPFPKP